jgi:hypothetical protein
MGYKQDNNGEKPLLNAVSGNLPVVSRYCRNDSGIRL